MESQFDKVVIALLEIGGLFTAFAIVFFGASIFVDRDGEKDARDYRMTMLPLLILAFGCFAVASVMVLSIPMLIAGLFYLSLGILAEYIFLKKVKSDKWQWLVMGQFGLFWVMPLPKLISHYVAEFDALVAAYFVLTLLVAAIYGTVKSIKDLPKQVERKKEAFFASYNALLEKAKDPHQNLMIDRKTLKEEIGDKYTAHSGMTLEEVYDNLKAAGYAIVGTGENGQLSFESRADDMTDLRTFLYFGRVCK